MNLSLIFELEYQRSEIEVLSKISRFYREFQFPSTLAVVASVYVFLSIFFYIFYGEFLLVRNGRAALNLKECLHFVITSMTIYMQSSKMHGFCGLYSAVEKSLFCSDIYVFSLECFKQEYCLP